MSKIFVDFDLILLTLSLWWFLISISYGQVVLSFAREISETRFVHCLKLIRRQYSVQFKATYFQQKTKQKTEFDEKTGENHEKLTSFRKLNNSSKCNKKIPLRLILVNGRSFRRNANIFRYGSLKWNICNLRHFFHVLFSFSEQIDTFVICILKTFMQTFFSVFWELIKSSSTFSNKTTSENLGKEITKPWQECFVKNLGMIEAIQYKKLRKLRSHFKIKILN